MPSSRLTAKERTAARRAAEAAAAAAAQRRKRAVLGGIAAGVVLVVAVVVVIVVQMQRTSTSADAPVPANTVEGGLVIAVGDPDAPVTVDIYEDFLCPACRQFEEQAGATLAELVADGSVLVRYRPIAILDRLSTDAYPTRSLNAAAAVVDAAGSDAFLAFHDALFAEQPAENGPGLTDERLVELAAEAGADGAAIAEAIAGLRFEDWTRTVTDAASRAGVAGTPTVLVDGQVLPPEQRSPEGLAAAVEAARAG